MSSRGGRVVLHNSLSAMPPPGGWRDAGVERLTPPPVAEGIRLSALTNDPAEVTGRPAAPAALRLMAVHAHPDDESSKGAATMARYVRDGVDVMVCTLTGGERGSILNQAMDRPEVRANLPRIRREEMARA